ncbi:peroxiredoxin family protein [Gordonia phthalatica]|uniref:peroxiredoxin family protein n=1 Tax=Gordonia phthalatica TaxID=1136941 RepID=UPI000A7AC6C9|nr:deiodinase-like protein [Gordonia phthalatica]
MTQDTSAATPEYNYTTFRLEPGAMLKPGGPQIGEIAPDFTASRLDGTEIALSELRGKTVVLETGSVTCPQYVSRVDPMNEMAARYPDAEFLVLYVREAHPGGRLPAHADAAHKSIAARVAVDEEREGRTILLDDLNGTAHQKYGSLPNTVHVIDPHGIVAYRAAFNEPTSTEAALRKILDGQDASDVPAPFRPAGMKHFVRALRRGGWRATWDILWSLPALALAHLLPGRR